MATAAEWAIRVRQWRASGERAREFCEGREYSAKNLLWWSSHLRRHDQAAGAARERPVTLARVIRRAAEPARAEVAALQATVVVEVLNARVQVHAGADRATVAMVLSLLREGAAGGWR